MTLLSPLLLTALSILSPQANEEWHLVARDEGGTSATPHLLSGSSYTFPAELVDGSESERTCTFGDPVVFGYGGADGTADYHILLTLASDGPRRQQLVVNDRALGEALPLSAGQVVTHSVDVPARHVKDGRLIVELRRLEGPNAVVSRIEILGTNPAPLSPLEPGSWSPGDFAIAPLTPREVNRLLPTYRPIPQSTEQAGLPATSLNGTWWVHPDPVAEWFADPAAMNRWTAVELPGQFLQQGIEFDPERPVACYRTFEVEPTWRTGRVILRFEAVFSFCRVFVNGELAGEHLGGMTPFELDVTELLVDRENTLALEVTSWSDADLLGSLSQYTAHPLGGILRDVTLFTVPDVHLTDLRITTPFDEAYEDAQLNLELELANTTDREATDLSLGILIHRTPIDEEPDLPPIPPRSRRRVQLSLPIPSPNKWDPEHPDVHHLQLFLAREGVELQSFAVPFGFREIERRGTELLVNGTPVKLRGANRHEVHPLRGRVVDRNTCIQDALLFREANCNYVRTSHYPPSRDFLNACDFLGLLVEVEAPLGWIGHGANRNWGELDARDSRWLEYQRQANLETVHFNRNHPSVVFWSLANESSWTRNFAEVLAAVQAADRSRPQAFHDQAWGQFNNRGSRAPIANLHYPGPGGPAYVAQSTPDRPVLFGEYCHLSVYNRRETVTDPAVRDLWGLALRPMWEEMYRTPGVLGGALWSGIDDVFHLPDGRTTGYGPWGLIDGWRRKKPEFWQVKKAYAPIVVHESRTVGPNLRLVEMENRFSFTNLDEVRILWQSEGDEAQLFGPDIAPGERGVLELEAPGDGPLLLTFTDPREVVVAEVFLDLPEPEALPAASPVATPRLEHAALGDSEVVRAGELELLLDPTTRQIERLSRGGETLLLGGPHLLAIPLHSDACAPEHQADLPPLTDVCSGWRFETVSIQEHEDEMVIVSKGAYDLAEGSFTLRLDSTGTLRVEYDFTLTVEPLVPRQLGVVFDLPRELDTVSWIRRAEWTFYPDDHIGRPRGSSPAFYADCPAPVSASRLPEWPWSHDAKPLGCNDFRATRSNFLQFDLSAADGRRVLLVGDGTGDARAWVDGDERIRVLAASLTVPTGEMFVRSHFTDVTPTLRRGAKIAGAVEIRFP